MLIRLSANRDEFTPIDFRKGFNAIVAERAKDSTDQDSRNARGKTTVLMLINYVLAGNRHKSLKPLADDGWEITLALDMFGGTVSATRSLARGGRLAIVATGPAREVLDPYLSEGTIGLADWKDLLGLALFRLEPSDQEITNGLSVRTLLSYVIRNDTPKDPLKILPQQGATSSRSHVSFLLGLDWNRVRQLADINKGIDQIKTIAAAANDGLVASLRTEDDLVLESAAIKNEVEEWQRRIAGFRVLEDPNDLVVRMDALTARIAALRDEAVVDRRMRALYAESLDAFDKESSANLAVEQLFAGVGAVLADSFKRRIEDVRAFHAGLLANRRTFLHSELEAIDARDADRSRALRQLDIQREDALRTVEAGGALEELNAMRTELGEAQARMAAVDQQLEQARELDVRRDELKLERLTKRAEATQELANSRTKVDQVGDRFRHKMNQLYGKDAALNVAVDDGGFKFSVKVTGAGSTGVDRMTMFCFDLTMLEEGIATAHHPDFLIHDSSVFDGVDPRQRAGAFRFAQQMVEATGGQYICTINSNDVPDDVLSEEWFRKGVVRTVLDTELGGLVGREF